MIDVLQYRAFTIDGDPTSGNPAGVVLDADDLTTADMLRTATALGHSETAFLSARTRDSAHVRYFSPRAEIAFCGHATIASGVALARLGADPVVTMHTAVGPVAVEATTDRATLTAVDTTVHALDDDLLAELLDALRLRPTELDPALPPVFVRGGNPHPIVPVRAGVLDHLDHDGDALLRLQDREGWDGTVPVVHRITDTHFVSRNPFPRGGIREDPATGSAAASLGAWLRAAGHLTTGGATTVGTGTSAEVTIDQGAATGRPCLLTVTIPATGRVRVTGTAAEL